VDFDFVRARRRRHRRRPRIGQPGKAPIFRVVGRVRRLRSVGRPAGDSLADALDGELANKSLIERRHSRAVRPTMAGHQWERGGSRARFGRRPREPNKRRALCHAAAGRLECINWTRPQSVAGSRHERHESGSASDQLGGLVGGLLAVARSRAPLRSRRKPASPAGWNRLHGRISLDAREHRLARADDMGRSAASWPAPAGDRVRRPLAIAHRRRHYRPA
jgi:hypothetical protein